MPANTSSRADRVAKRRGVKLTPAVIASLNKLEAQLQIKAQSDPKLKIAFGKTTTFFSELKKLSPEDRTAKLKSIRLAAEDEFADFFQQKRGNLTEDFEVEIDRLNRDFKFANEDTLQAFKSKIAGLDRDTVAAIGASFRSLIDRGLGASGAMKSMADRIIAQRTITADTAKQIRDKSIRDIGIKKSDKEEDINVGFERGKERIDSSELFNVKAEEERLTQRESDLILQTNELTGVNALAPREVVGTKDSPDPTDPLSVRLKNLETEEEDVEDTINTRTIDRRNNRIARNNLTRNAS